MFREPWFRILDVVDPRGRSIAEISAEAAREMNVPLDVLRGTLYRHRLHQKRLAVYSRIKAERPDVPSSQIGRYFNRDPSSVRKALSKVQMGEVGQ